MHEIEEYYNTKTDKRLHDFIYGNLRIERAWETIKQYGRNEPKEVLEIGCGIGAIAWRMSEQWPQATITALDLSMDAINIAKQLFASPRITFLQGSSNNITLDKCFDIIVLMDVYEHINRDDRYSTHCSLGQWCSKQGRIVLSVPTPKHLAWLRKNRPCEIQPIDEDVTFMDIVRLTSESNTDILLYKEVGIWNEGDYAHVVLQKSKEWQPAHRRNCVEEGGHFKKILKRLVNIINKATPSQFSSANRKVAQRKEFVRSRLHRQ